MPTDPVRLCVMTRERLPKASMLRFLLDPAGQPVVDLLGKLGGRGVYVKSERRQVMRFLNTKVLSRAFKRQVSWQPKASEDFMHDLVERFDKRLIELCRLGKRSGDLFFGVDSVIQAAEAGQLQVLFWAEDASEGSLRRSKEGTIQARPLCYELSASKGSLGEALGRSELAVLGFKQGKLAARAALDAQRRAGLVKELVFGLEFCSTEKLRARHEPERADKV